MTVNKKKKIMLAAIIMAIAVFVVSAFAAGANLSGYERLKAAGFKLIEESYKSGGGVYSNGMFWVNAALYIDDVGMAFMENIYLRDGDREFNQNKTKVNQNAIDSFGIMHGAIDNDIITYSDNEVYYTWYAEDIFFESSNYRWNYNHDPSGYNNGSSSDESSITPSERLFIEAIADALIGDTRNYFIADGNMVSISLSGNQIPQIAQYAVAALTERANSELIYDFDNNIELGVDARITYGLLVVELDNDDNVIGAKFSSEIASTVNGAPRTYRLEVEYHSKNIGSTVLARPEGNTYGKPILPPYDAIGGEDGGNGAAGAGVTYAPGAVVA